MANRTWTEKANEWIEDGVTKTDGLMILESSHPDIRGAPRFVGGDQCCVCGVSRARDEFTYYEGCAFCTRRGCAGNIKHYSKSGRARHDVVSFEPIEGGI